MSDRVIDKAYSISCLHYILFSFNGNATDTIQSIVERVDCTELTNRFSDFFNLVSTISNCGNWEKFSLQDLLQSIENLERKYFGALSAAEWNDLKVDILFQIYLCVLREAAAVGNDDRHLSESVDNFNMPSCTASAYRNRIDWLMGKYQHYYAVENERSQVFAQQRDALLNITVAESGAGKGDVEGFAFNKVKVFVLLKTFKMEAFKQHIARFIRYVESKALPVPITTKHIEYVTPSCAKNASFVRNSPQPGGASTSVLTIDTLCARKRQCLEIVQDQKTTDHFSQHTQSVLPKDETPATATAPPRAFSPAVCAVCAVCAPEASPPAQNVFSGTNQDQRAPKDDDSDSKMKTLEERRAAYLALLRRADNFYGNSLKFRTAYKKAKKDNTLTEETSCRDITSHDFWRGRGRFTVNSVEYQYTKSLVVGDDGEIEGLITADGDSGGAICYADGFWDCCELDIDF